MKRFTAVATTVVTAATLLAGTAHSAQARPGPDPMPDWDKRVHCREEDPEGRDIVTRWGNGELGWKHFTYRHNIRKCGILGAAIRGKVDRDDHHGRLEYDGVAIRTGPKPAQVDFVVIVQYTRRTKDKRYDAGKGQKIGVVNAFCRNQPRNKCPAWMNE
ncbi:hypothetical protein [Streptomyces sp. SAJ15]|uniref:hypothetical protein n=1 Tax=Streptomyces sp. SAJ15 TaxID=2011095 RepID=UPI0011864FF9|nr:hypothetical protein [Streptomyces sp. SAJ15]TVL87787.1 hypothetical protein CD790_32920 [Streptomyces sp. SAJ15]